MVEEPFAPQANKKWGPFFAAGDIFFKAVFCRWRKIIEKIK